MLALMLAVMMAQAQTPAVATLVQGSSSGVDAPREVVVRSPAEWAALWKAHAAPQTAPVVDFSTNVVAAVFLGTRPTAGFRVDIVGARREADVLVIEYAERAPGADSIVAQVLTAPFHIVTLPRYDGPIRFRKTAVAGSVP